MGSDYSLVTELPGDRASQEQLSRLYHRYCTASRYCEGKDVLEVGCGAGQGLGYLVKKTRFVVGGDYTAANLYQAQAYYKGRVKLVRLDAHHLPFSDGSFDAVILFEAIYYLARPKQFLDESHRVLRKNGVLVICTVNKDWPEFNPSPFSVRYFSAPELAASLREKRFEVKLFGAYLAPSGSVKDRIISILRRTAVALHLIPKSFRYKAVLKRIFFGKLVALPPEIGEGTAEYTPPTPISCETPDFRHKILYAIGHVR